MRRSFILCSIAFTAAFGFSGCASFDENAAGFADVETISACGIEQEKLASVSETADEIVAAYISHVEETMGVANQYGFSVAVSMCGEMVFSRELGYSDLENQTPVNTATKFRIGSVSKPITAIALGQLFEKGAINFDSEVQTHAPTFPSKDHPITIRQIAGHLSGIRHYNSAQEFFSADRYETVTDALVIFQDDPLIAIPGTKYSYSSYGWNLLSVVVENASGEPFLEYMQSNIFDKAQMHETAADEPHKIIPNRSRFYSFDDESNTNQNAPLVDQSNKWAGGGFLSTPRDLLRFAKSIRENELISAKTLSILTETQFDGDGVETGYGIGWVSGRTYQDWESDVFSEDTIIRARAAIGETKFMGHSGGSVGGRTLFLMTQGQGADVAIAAVSNNDNFPPEFTIPVLAAFVDVRE